jgi:hypothetical protein
MLLCLVGQVDLMPLMLTISKKGSIGARWVSGTFHLVSAASKDLGAARIRAKVRRVKRKNDNIMYRHLFGICGRGVNVQLDRLMDWF